MVKLERSALVGYSAAEMFDLVNDIEHYPQFMQGCRSAKVLSSSDNELIGELCLAKAGISHCFTTRNLLSRPTRIDMQLVAGNFSTFRACWIFTALTETACKVTLNMEFEFKTGLVEFAAGKLFSSSANSLVDAVVARAAVVYQ